MPIERLWIIILLLSVATAGTAGGVYKWTDAQGNVHYGERPPPGIEAKSLKVDKAPLSSDEAAVELEKLGIKAGIGPTDEQQQGQATEAVGVQPTAEQTEAIQRNCEIARQNVATLERYRRVMTQDGSGAAVRLDENERAARMEKARKQVEEFCD